jgi:cold shock CspA family protein
MEEDVVQKIIEKEVDPTTGRARGYGFIHRDDNPRGLHFSLGQIRTGAADLEEGWKVTFEEGTDAQGRPTAKRIRILERADGTPYVQGQKKGEVEAPQELAVDFEVRDPHPWFITMGRKKEERMRLPVWVIVTFGGKPVLNEEVKLDADGSPVVQGIDKAFTLKDGRAFFPPLLSVDATSCHLVATVRGNTYSYFWQKKIPKAATPTEPTTAEPEPIADPTTKPVSEPVVAKPEPEPKLEVEKNGPDAEGVYFYRIKTTPKSSIALKATLLVEGKGPNDEQWTTGPFIADDEGNLELCVRGKTPGTRGEVHFETRGLRSKPRYTEHRNRS